MRDLQHYALTHHPECTGFLTLDADSQHHPEDVGKVAAATGQTPDAFIIGVRDFHCPSVAIPWRSRFGNQLTATIFRRLTGIGLRDTQSGLRCYPAAVAREIVKLPYSRYDFLLAALLTAAKLTKLVQVPVRTIYEEGNRRSHFRPVRDSLRIYAALFRLGFRGRSGGGD